MKDVNDFVKWICGMGLVLIALTVLAMFLIDYGHGEQQVSAATGSVQN